MESPHHEDAELRLLEAWYQGDRAALASLISSIEPWLNSQVRRELDLKVRVSDDTVDVVNTTLVKFLTWGPRFRPQSLSQFRALLFRIAKNEIIDARRRAEVRRVSHFESLSGVADAWMDQALQAPSSWAPNRRMMREEERHWVQTALEFLDPEDRYALIAIEVEGRSLVDTARELGGITPDGLRTRLNRLKPKLANYMRILRDGRAPPVD